MPASHVVSVVAASTTTNTVTTAAVDTTGATLIVLSQSNYSGAPITSITDSKGNTWIPRIEGTQGNVHTRLYYAENPVVGAGHTFSVNGSGVYPAVCVSAFAGTVLASVFGQESSFVENGGVNTQPAGLITPSEDGMVFVTAIGQPSAVSGHTVNLGFAVIGQLPFNGSSNEGLAMAWMIQPTAAAINPQWSWSSGFTTGVAMVASFKASTVPPVYAQAAYRWRNDDGSLLAP
jgi:hypothetical protein